MKAAEPTRCSDTSDLYGSPLRYAAVMKRLILLIAVIALVVVAVKKVQSS